MPNAQSAYQESSWKVDEWLKISLMRQKFYDTAVKQERAVLVGVITPNETEAQEKEYLEELQFLVETAGAATATTFTQKLQRPDRATFVGSGKLEDIKAYVTAEDIDMVVFDDELTPSQLRNIEKELGVKILDRNNLILDIFAGRAQTAQAKAQYRYAWSGRIADRNRPPADLKQDRPAERKTEAYRPAKRDAAQKP